MPGPAIRMNSFVRLANWILEPAVFLLIRLLGDFVAAVYLLVGVVTVFSDAKARKRDRGEAA